jgi:hypothetical protein
LEELKISEYPTPEPPVLLTVISMLPPVIFSLARVNSILYLKFSTEHSLTELSAGGASIYLKFNKSNPLPPITWVLVVISLFAQFPSLLLLMIALYEPFTRF